MSACNSRLGALAVCSALLLAACASTGQDEMPARMSGGASKRLTAVGYGTAAPYTNLTYGQQKLMAIRAAQVDAYPNLAEQIKGVSLTATTSTAAFSSQGDTIKAQTEAMVRGARVIHVASNGDGNWEVRLEIDVPEAH